MRARAPSMPFLGSDPVKELAASVTSGAWAVLVAAGRGERLGGERPKAFAQLRGRPLLAESLERLDSSEWIEAVVVVAPEGWEEPSILLAEELGVAKVRAAVTGGATRSDSVRAGLAEVPEEAAVVLVHDAARPFLPPEVVERVVSALGDGWDGAVPALPVGDTLKRADGERVLETVDRAGIYAVQTPQAFVAATLSRAAARTEEATDCAGLVEAAGGLVRLVEGDPRLLKVTTSADLQLVDTLLGA
jgi:2-C-methyl-D-erythritol 4-phosphate cytidylyltransferase